MDVLVFLLKAVAVAVSMKGKVMDVDFGVSGGRNGSGFGCGSIICCGEMLVVGL